MNQILVLLWKLMVFWPILTHFWPFEVKLVRIFVILTLGPIDLPLNDSNFGAILRIGGFRIHFWPIFDQFEVILVRNFHQRFLPPSTIEYSGGKGKKTSQNGQRKKRWEIGEDEIVADFLAVSFSSFSALRETVLCYLSSFDLYYVTFITHWCWNINSTLILA